jgi:phage recombination protein Bet
MTQTSLAMPTPTVTDEQMSLITSTVAKGASPDQLKLYLYDCARRGVHPLDKLIHFTLVAGKYTPITSIDFLRSQAAATGEYAGSDDAVYAEGENGIPAAASVTVYRIVQGHRCSFAATARYDEYLPRSGAHMWSKMPYTMLSKCAEALALRKAFPQQTSGLYTADEMQQAEPVYTMEAATTTTQTLAGDAPNGRMKEQGLDEQQAATTGVVLSQASRKEARNGSPYVAVRTSDGRSATSYDEDIIDQCLSAYESATMVTIDIQSVKGHNKVMAISPALGSPVLDEAIEKTDDRNPPELTDDDIPF